MKEQTDAKSETPLSEQTALTRLEPRGPAGLPLMEVGEGTVADPGRSPSAGRPFSLRLLAAYRWSVLGVFLLASCMFIVGVWASVVPEYTATATIEVSPVIPQLLAGESDMVPLYESYRQSQVDHITGSEVLDAVLDHPEIRRTNWYQQTPISLVDRLRNKLGLWSSTPPRDRLSDEIVAKAPPRKQLVMVQMSAPTRHEAKLIVDAAVAEYARFTRSRISGDQVKQEEELRRAKDLAEQELFDIERQISALRATLGTGTPEQIVDQRLLRLDKLTAELGRLEMERKVKQNLLSGHDAGAKNDTETPAIPDVDCRERYGRDPIWQRLNLEAADRRRDVELAQRRLGDRHPELVGLRQTLAAAERRLAEREAEIDATPDQKPVSPQAKLREEIDVLTIRIDALKELVREAHDGASQLSTDAETLTKLRAAYQKNEQLLQTLSQRLYEMRMDRQVAGRIQESPAYEPSTPSVDKRLKFMALGLIAALGLAVGQAFVRHRISDHVQDLGDVVGPPTESFLGYLPLRRRPGAVSLDNCPEQAESVRLVRTALLNRMRNGSGFVVQISSAAVGAGKSTLAALLAQSLARCGKRVLLVDADVRRPSLARRFAISPSPGLLDVLTAREPPAGAICATNTPNLSILPSGTPARQEDVELLANGALASQLAVWRSEYDVVLLDGPPLLSTADGAILSRHADGTIMLVRERHCRRGELAEALTVLNTTGGRLLGVVFVGSKRARAYDYYYGYQYSYAMTPQVSEVTTGTES